MNEPISECVEVLKEIRRTIHNYTDPSIGVALDAVIAKFEGYIGTAKIDEADVKVTVSEALVVISSVLTCCSSIADLISRFL
jgi:hypothetical protein